MLPHKHVIISATVGAVGWWGIGEPAAGAVALAAGVLPDVDHIVDYAYFYWRRKHRLFLPLHGYEFAILGAVLAVQMRHAILGVGVVSYLLHLLADQTENRTHILGYSLLFRAWNQFRIEKISTVPDAAAQGRVDDINALRNLLYRRRK